MKPIPTMVLDNLEQSKEAEAQLCAEALVVSDRLRRWRNLLSMATTGYRADKERYRELTASIDTRHSLNESVEEIYRK
jgi:hypothetical protein